MSIAPTRPPIACTLGDSELHKRLTDIAALNAQALRQHRRDGSRLELTYAPEAKARVLAMVEAERRCCAFLSFTVREEVDRLLVTIEAPEGAMAGLEAIFEPFLATSPPAGGCGCAPSSPAAQDAKPPAPSRSAGVAAGVATAGVLACAVCCVLPFALPAASLGILGGVIAWIGRFDAFAAIAGVLSVLGAWTWIAVQSRRTGARPAPATIVTLSFATLLLVAILFAPTLLRLLSS